MSRPCMRKLAGAWLAALLLIMGMPAFAAGAPASSSAKATTKAGKSTGNWEDFGKWRPVTPEELAMTAEPKAPGASAIYLYTQVDRNDDRGVEESYRQIKVLSEEGRNLANVSINYNQLRERVSSIEARVVQPDGTIVPFSGKIYDRPLVASRDLGIYSKIFTLPDVRVGSVIEYRFRRDFDTTYVLYSSRWLLSQDLFARFAQYSLRMSTELGVRWSWPAGLPEGTVPPKEEGGMVRMQIRNVPAFVTEDYMPPAADLVLAVNFIYVSEVVPIADSARFWNEIGRIRMTNYFKSFIGNPDAVRDRLGGIIGPGDSTEQKVRKIYAHVQQLRYADDLSTSDTAGTGKACKQPLSAKDVARNGCGTGEDLQMYFIALLRAAEIHAMPALVASRQDRFFQPQSNLTQGITGWLVDVTIDGKQVLLEPAIPVLPYGFLPWVETAVPALRYDNKDWKWITTPMTRSQDAVARRKAQLVLSEDGVLEGTVTVRHSGHEAIQRLMSLHRADEQARVEALQDDLLGDIAVPAEVAVTRQPDWNSHGGVIETEYRVKVRDWAVSSGSRLMVGTGLFGGEQARKFVSPTRVHPIYFAFPFTAEDEIEIALPAGFTVQSVPQAKSSTDSALGYVTSVESKDGKVTIRRSLTHDVLLAKETAYSRFKSFYELVRTGDQEQVVLSR